jgi:large subunit ribosomal protein L18
VTSKAAVIRNLRIRRHARVRNKVVGTADRPRLAVSRSHKHISAQAIDDAAGRTLVSASSNEADLRKSLKGGGANIAGAEAVGKLIGSRAKQAGITRLVFDRGGFAYHGRVAALADAVRAQGLEL